MKKVILTALMALVFLVVSAQENSYIVKTRNVKKGVTPEVGADLEALMQQEQTAADFIGQNFKFYSLCDWEEGMKFMVLPEKYDLVVKTFTDASTGKESKTGVPTLAYLGDVDIARDKLMGKTLYTKTQFYRIDTDYDSDGFQDVIVDKDMEVKVTAIGVGTRSFPVKIIVEDKDGNEFYQNVAISKTNCGMRDDEFVTDNAKYLFKNSFELVDDIMAVNSYNYKVYLGRIIHTKYPTAMLNEVTKKVQAIPRMAEYQIETITPHKTDDKATIKLKNTTLGTFFFIDMVLDSHRAERQEDYFGYLFAPGPGKKVQTSESSRAMIRQGHVGIGFSEDEVMMAAGEPNKIQYGQNGQYTWIFNRSNNKLLFVDFDGTGSVSKYYTKDGPAAAKSPSSKRPSSKMNPKKAKAMKNATPL